MKRLGLHDKEKKLSQEEIFKIINERNIEKHKEAMNYQKSVSLSVESITEDERIWIRNVLSKEDSKSSLTREELNWLRQHCEKNNLDYDFVVTHSAEYIRLRQVQIHIEENKDNIRRILDSLRRKSKSYTPEELIELGSENARKKRSIENFSGIYIIHNSMRDNYYVGKSIKIFNRAYKHFISDPAKSQSRYSATVDFNLPEIYDDYYTGHQFNINLIRLEDTSYRSLDDLELYAIGAYNASLEYGGYNRTHGNIVKKVSFDSPEHQKVAELLLNTIKESEIYSTLTNDRKRMTYTSALESELMLPKNISFSRKFWKMIKEYQRSTNY